MRAPSTQLLRILRDTINPSYQSSRLASVGASSSIRAARWHTPASGQFSTSAAFASSNKSNSTPTRSIPRSHPGKPSLQNRVKRATEEEGEENTHHTDIAQLNVLGSVPTPATAIDACFDEGFQLNNGLKILNGDGVLLVGGEVFVWRPWLSGTSHSQAEKDNRSGVYDGLINAKGQFEVPQDAWGLFSLVWPRPEILILGLGASMFPVSPQTKRDIHSLGIRVEIQDTRNAAAQFNLLATERGVGEVAAAMLPAGWRKR